MSLGGGSMKRKALSVVLAALMVFQWVVAPVAIAADITISSQSVIAIQQHTIPITPPNMSPIKSYAGNNPSIIFPTKDESGHPLCGGVGQKPCGDQPARFTRAAVGACPKGSFFDIGTWACYSCPSGYSRSLAKIDDYKACQKQRAKPKLLGTFVQAEKVGTVCPKGSFFDPIRGGECWSCPSGYVRTVFSVEAKNACQKGGILGPVKKASKVSRAECGKGEIKDGIGGNGGSCWVCPENHDRTIFAVNGNKACEKSEWYDFKKATKTTDLTCPAGEIFDFIGLSAADIRSRPEFKTGTSPKPVAGGTCWQCPEGYDRTMSGVKGNDACRAKFMVWQPGIFNNQGLFGFAAPGTVETVLMNIVKRDPGLIAAALDKAAKEVAKTNKKPVKTVLEAEKNRLLTDPGASTVAAGIVMRRIMAAIADSKKVTADEKALAEAFGTYIQKRRTFMAKEALAAYYAWKAADQEARNKRSQNMLNLIDYGTVPPDFGSVVAGTFVSDEANSAVSTAAGIAAGSLPVVGDILGDLVSMGTGATLSGFGDFSSADGVVSFATRNAAEIAISKAVEMAVEQMVKATAKQLSQQVMTKALAAGAIKATAEKLATQASSRLLTALSGSGPAIILAVEGMVLSMSIDNFIQISEAEGRLKTTLTTAQRPVTLDQLARMAKTQDGASELLSYWGFLISGNGKPNATFLKDWGKALPAAFEVPQVKASSASSTTAASRAAPSRLGTQWKRMPGAATDIGAGPANGVAVVGGDGAVFVWDEAHGKWNKMPGTLARIDMRKDGAPVGVNAKGEVWAFVKEKWVKLPGTGRDIGVGANGSTWLIGTKPVPGGFDILHWTKGGFQPVKGGAVRVDVGPKGTAWVVNDKGAVFHSRKNGWQHVKAAPKAKDIAVGEDGSVYLLGADGVPYHDDGGKWVKLPGKGENITVDADGVPWLTNDKKEIFAMVP